MTTKLQLILNAMAQATINNDTESAHYDADLLLIDTIECLVEELPQYEELIGKILVEYDSVCKWFA